MNILVMGMNYVPEKTAIGPLTAELCEYLAIKGHYVVMVTAFPHYPEWKIQDEYKGKIFTKEFLNGVFINRCWVYVPTKLNSLQRIAYDCSFSFSAFISSLLKIQKMDAILCISPPLQLGLAAWMISKLRKIPFFFQIYDLIPDTALDLGMLRNGKVIKLAYLLEKFVYGAASSIGVISHGFAEKLYSKGVPKNKIYNLPIWINTDFIKPGIRNNSFRQQHGLFESTFLVMYTGNLGNKQGLASLLDAALILQKQKDIFFIIIGEGANKMALIEKKQQLNLSNLRLLGFQPRKRLAEIYAAADVLALTQKASVIDICMPSKLIYYMASGTAIVASVSKESEAARTLTKAYAGLVVPPEDPKALAKAILRLYNSEEIRNQFGANGRAFVSKYFEKSKILRKFENLLFKIAQ